MKWIILTGFPAIALTFTLGCSSLTSIRFFRHEPDVERVVHMVTKKSQELGATHLTDLYSWSDSVWGSFSLIFWYRWTSVSANASTLPQAPAPHTIH
jgi:hypothetical protein